jgi:aspartyl-tRNA(Asn)/glutamyl-tRNA(Gln) amidotransferase subunit C
MTISLQELKKIADLARLDPEFSDPKQLAQDINAIMDLVDQLRSVDTAEIAPLAHPFALHQRLRMDAVTEEECIAELEAIAPLFENDLYLVPKKIIESDA